MLQPNDEIDIWVVDHALGSGGMGSVYRCHNRSAARILAAVKVLDSALQKHPEAQARFIREAEILFQLDHPNIVKVRNVRIDHNPPYLEMEFVEGESLEERLRRGALPYSEAVDYMQQICSAVAYLHKTGVCHRDIKPANLLVTRQGKCKLVDFGLAMEADTTRITQQGMTFGTVSYAPPEWIAPDTLDPERWDLYAIGIVFYELLTGKLAFPVSGQGSARQQAMQVIVGKQGHDPLDPGDQFEPDVRSLIRDLTQSDASKRLSSAAEAVRRSRELVRSLRREAGVTLAPMQLDEEWDDDLAVSPERPERVSSDTWHGAGDSSPGMASSLDLDERPGAPPAASRPRAKWIPAAVGGLALLGLVGTAAFIAAFLYAGSSRDVAVIVSGLPSDSPVDVRLNGVAPTSVRDMTYTFDAVGVGDATLQWAQGDRCTAEDCPGEECDPWCGADERTVLVEPGTGVQSETLTLNLPGTRRVRLQLPELGEVPAGEFSLAGQTGRAVEGAVLFDAIPPGNHELRASVGECDRSSLGCWPQGECPDDCRSYRGKLPVPWGEGEVSHALDLPTPSPSPTPGNRTETRDQTTGPVSTEQPEPAQPPQPAESGASGCVTVRQFAAWLANNPSWHSEAAIADGRATPGYLAGWTGATPPEGASGAVLPVNWNAAAQYCASRGGLADLDAAPLEWQEGPNQPWIEYRIKGNRPAWRMPGSEPSTQIDPTATQALAGFRCAR